VPAELVCFLSYAPITGGVSTYQAHHLTYLSGRTGLALIDEVPATSLARVDPSLRAEVEVLQPPLWSAPSAAAPLIARWISERRPAVISTSNPGLLVRYHNLLRRARRTLGTRVVLTHHSGILTMTPRRFLMAAASSLAALALDEIVYVTCYTRAYWERRYPWMRLVPSRIVPNGIPIRTDVTSPRRPGTPLRVAFVGRLEREKGIDVFCDVARLSRAARLPMEFHVYGDGSWRGRIARDYPADVIAHGHVEDSDEIFEAVDLLLLTSPVENCPFAALEAMNLGVPCVAPPVGGLPEMLGGGNGAVLSSGRSPAALLDALGRAADDYTRLSAACLDRRREFELGRRGREMWEPLGVSPGLSAPR
jgi:glycosyltransferase involved in cell wall biosynthesis